MTAGGSTSWMLIPMFPFGAWIAAAMLLPASMTLLIFRSLQKRVHRGTAWIGVEGSPVRPVLSWFWDGNHCPPERYSRHTHPREPLAVSYIRP
jgi:hypothetical protein